MSKSIQYRTHVSIDTLYNHLGKKCGLADWQAKPLSEPRLIPCIRTTDDGKLVVRYFTSYTPDGKSWFLVNQSNGAHIPLNSALTRGSADEEAPLTGGSRLAILSLDRFGAKPESSRALHAGEAARMWVRSRCLFRNETPAKTSRFIITRTGNIVPCLMAEENVISKKYKKAIGFRMYVPGEGFMNLVKLPIPLLLDDVKYLTRSLKVKEAYTEDDIKLHLRIFKKAVQRFLKKYKIDRVYAGLPAEGSVPYATPGGVTEVYDKTTYASSFLRIFYSTPYKAGKHPLREVMEYGRVTYFNTVQSGKLDFIESDR